MNLTNNAPISGKIQEGFYWYLTQLLGSFINMRRISCILILFILLIVAGISRLHAQTSDCVPAGEDRETYQGGNQVIVYIRQKANVELHGTVEDWNGKPVDGTLVEVFNSTKEHWLGKDSVRTLIPNMKRIVACAVGAKGRFGFPALPAGYYELRFSGGDGWNLTRAYIRLTPDVNKRKGMRVRLEVGT